MQRYPHTLFVYVNTEVSKDGLGNWVQSVVPSPAYVSECREEVNGAAKTIVLTDGSSYQFLSKIYLPICDVSKVTHGDTIWVIDSDNVTKRLEGKVARISIERKHIQIWV